MSVGLAPSRIVSVARHPNEIDLLRIARALAERQRYRYVQPEVVPVSSGYLVRSPCCSRRPDPEGGVVDIARLVWADAPACWLLYRKAHEEDLWVEDSSFVRLTDALARLNADPDRRFWQ
ncbi:hypothetical protein FHW96_004692 [Novosphingobium sp. SG751A]|uniref:DUF3024 domain-containing protein n=1 Tax=Novosphingobium sp. SG751A TaxID=2587000 RepID=UPI0015560ABE|nr:hypothetical protein [Novosphingobium sp. SG751A]NOW48504.1 hypothetical protein [Novosphingobium sp. SG751A]